MSEVDKEEFKREYLPLISDGDKEPTHHQIQHATTGDAHVSNPGVNPNRSVISMDEARSSDQKYQNVNVAGAASAAEQTFYQKNKKIIFIALGILLFIGVVLAIVLPLTLGGGGHDNPPIPPPPPLEPDPFMYQEFNPYYVDENHPPAVTTFEAAIRLQFNHSSFNMTGGNVDSLHEVPKSLRGFMTLEKESEEVTKRRRVLLEEKDIGPLNGSYYRPVNPRHVINSTNNIWASNVDINVEMNNNFQSRVLITNADSNPNETLRRQVNSRLFPRPNLEIEARLQQVGFSYNSTASFALNFSDIYTKEVLVSTMYRKLLLTDMYSQIGLVVPTHRCFGLGQRNGKFQLDSGTYSFNARARDDGSTPDDGLGGKSGNHIHPFMLCQTAERKDFFGMFFASNAPQVFEIVKFSNSTKMVVNYITLGGVIEFYMIQRGTAQEIISRYHTLVGMPMMVPYYALGVFHGSNSYNKWSQVKAVYDNYGGALTGAKQALEGVFVEDFNQQQHWTFTVNQDNFPNLGAEVDKIHAKNQRIIFGASMALSSSGDYQWYNQAKQGQCLIKSFAGLAIGPLTGILHQTYVQYLDTFNGCFDTLMASAIPQFNRDTAHGLDGLIVSDAHSPNHINGQIIVPAEFGEIHGRNLLGADPAPVQILNEEMVGFYAPYKLNNDTVNPPPLSTYYMPFVPAYKYSGALDNMSISLNATLGDDLGGGRYSSLLVRNGISGYALKRTYNAVQNLKQNQSRALLFSDASWSGSGSYSVALLTDMWRSWGDMNTVISQVVALSMYGMSATMVDTCGSIGHLDEELCARWTQLATFMPMVRNYYNSTYRDRDSGDRRKTQGSEPWKAETDIARLAYAALGDRLRLSRYIYSQMYLTHTQGGSLVRPLFFDYPNDDTCFSDEVQSSTYMLGDAIKVTPLLIQSKNEGESYSAYFPQGVWVNLYNPSEIISAGASGTNVKLPIDAAQGNVHIKSGTIIPYLNNNQNARTTKDVELNLKTTFKIVRDPQTLYAEGHIMIDDGISPNNFSPSYMDTYLHQQYDKNFTHYQVRYASNKTINFMLQNGDLDYKPSPDMQYQYLEQIDILNAEDLQDSDFACSLNRSWTPTNMSVYYTDSTKTLTIKPLIGGMTFDQLMLIKFGNSKKDISYCNGFTYKAAIVDEGKADTYVQYNLTSTQAPGVLEDLVAEFTLIDDDGSVLVEITTVSDFYSGKKIIYRPPIESVNIPNYYKDVPERNLPDFLQVDTNNFAYTLRNAKGDVVYSSDPLRLMITKYFVIDSTNIQTNSATGRPLMGIGERAGRAMFKNEKDTVHTIWPYDAPNPIDDGKPPGKNAYGYQPLYYYQTESSSWVGVFDIGTAPADYFINTDVDGQGTAKVTKVSVGGLVYKVILQSLKIESNIKKYQQITGFQSVPPMWAFGWNQCKFGYYNEDIWWGAYQNYTTFNIPLDTMWADIDYMDDYKVFTISQQTYPNLPSKVDQIKKDGRYFVPIIDNAIAVRKNMGYTPYESGMDKGVFIQKADLSGPATGGVWPGHAYYPDFFKKETVSWWQDNLKTFNQKVKFDGIWLDMNEPSSTCVGYCYQDERPADSIKFNIPYLPGQRDLEVQALGLDTLNTGMPKEVGSGYRNHLEARSLYAIKESQATFDYLKSGGTKRPFILSRSNAPGLQKFAFHWLADNWSQTEWMETSIDSIYNYNLFGIPMMGSDICGFNLDATPQLCTRWHQLGSFYPFARNHKNSVWRQTEPFQYNFTVPDLDDGRTYTDLIRTALLQRYSLLRYIYSTFHQIGEVGGAFFKPLYYEFQDDVNTFDEDSTQRNILLGDALKLSIQVHSFDQLSTEYLFPASRWCQVFPVIDPSKCWDTTTQGGASTKQRLDSGIADYQVHIRGGRMIPYQNASALNVTKSQDLMNNPTELIVLANTEDSLIPLDPTNYTARAAGLIYLDDGTSATDIGRFDFEVIAAKDGQSFTIDLHTINDLKNRAAAGQASTLSAITFVWASQTGYKQIKTAKIIEISGASIDINAPVYDSVTDTLRVSLANSQQGKSWAFWDIDKIVISN